MSEEKQYPRDERALVDASVDRLPVPCARPLRMYSTITWCELEDGHAGDCSGPEPRALEPSEGVSMRLRGLKHDLFADKFEGRNKR